MSKTNESKPARDNEFARHATARRNSYLSEFYFLLKGNKKWWMAPLIMVFLAFGILMIVASSGAAPFIYSLF